MFKIYFKGENIRIKIFLLVIIAVQYIQAQAWFPLEVGYKYLFMKKTWQADIPLNEHWEYELYHIEVLSDTMIADQKYFKTSRYPDTWIRHDCRDSKTYIRWDAKDHLFMNYALPADTLFQHLDPETKLPVEVMALDSSKYFSGEERIMKGYRNFETTPTGYTDLYFTPDIGFFNIYHQHQIEGGGVTTINYDMITAQFTLTYFTDGHLPQINHNNLSATSDSVITLTATVDHFNNHIFPAGTLDTGINFIDSVKIKSRYRHNDLIIENPTIECANIPYTADWFAEIDLDLYLLQNGYSFEYYIEAIDKALVPVYAVSPDSGHFSLIYNPTNIDNNGVINSSIELFQNYPNPFNPTTTISYTLSGRSIVTIKVFDILGNLVSELINEEQSAGDHNFLFDGSALPSGVYVCKLNAGDYNKSIKLILLK